MTEETGGRERVSLDFLDLAIPPRTLRCPNCEAVVHDGGSGGAKAGITVCVNIPGLMHPLPPGVYVFRNWRGPAPLAMARVDAPLPEILVCGDDTCARAVEEFVRREVGDWAERHDLLPPPEDWPGAGARPGRA